ncbi:MAG: hypothetical protein GY772_17230 [bacterium]|nr:hypothetical protein [bacterium]
MPLKCAMMTDRAFPETWPKDFGESKQPGNQRFWQKSRHHERIGFDS